MPTVIPPASPISLYRWRPIRYPGSSARSPAYWQALIGLPHNVRIALTSSALPPTHRFCPSISSRDWPKRSMRHAPTCLRRLGWPPHPVFGLWPVRLRDDLRRAVVDQGIRKVDLWTARHQLTTVSFPVQPVDPFFNANRPEDLETAAALLRAIAG